MSPRVNPHASQGDFRGAVELFTERELARRADRAARASFMSR
jgi:hypothetical protein